jgi:hypothetical protein
MRPTFVSAVHSIHIRLQHRVAARQGPAGIWGLRSIGRFLENPAQPWRQIQLNRNRYLTFSIALMLTALVVFARCGHTLQAAASPRGVVIEPKSLPSRDDEDDNPRRLRRDEDPSDFEGGDKDSGDGDDPTTNAGGLTAPTASGTPTTATTLTHVTAYTKQPLHFLDGSSVENRLVQLRRRSSWLGDQPEDTE